jgi:hypothetical protein
MFHKRLIRATTVGLTLTAVAAPAAGARPADWPINPPEHSTKVVDLRSPDARDAAAKSATHAAAKVDLRSPDARDAAAKSAGHAAAKAPVPGDLHLRRSAPAGRSAPVSTTHGVSSPVSTHKSDGTDWKDVGIIGGSGLGVLLTGFGVAVATRRKSATRKSRAPALTR